MSNEYIEITGIGIDKKEFTYLSFNGSFIPMDPANSDYQAYLASLEVTE